MRKLQIDPSSHPASPSANKTLEIFNSISLNGIKSNAIKRDTVSRPLKTIPNDCEKIHNCVESEKLRLEKRIRR